MMNGLRNTVKWMMSEDYKERFQAEYWQLKIRLDGLNAMLKKYEEGTLDFKPTCPIEVLKTQRDSMDQYLKNLQERAGIEEIKLTYPPEPTEVWTREKILWAMACMRQLAEHAGGGAAFDAIGQNGPLKERAEAAAKKAWAVCLGVTNAAGVFGISERELCQYEMTDADKDEIRKLLKESKERNDKEQHEAIDVKAALKAMLGNML